MTSAEKEEMVLFSHADEVAVVYSHSPSVWAACRRAGGRLKESHKIKGKEVAQDWEVPLPKLAPVLSWVADAAKKISFRNGDNSPRPEQRRAS